VVDLRVSRTSLAASWTCFFSCLVVLLASEDFRIGLVMDGLG
jgi:hypothetical protein